MQTFLDEENEVSDVASNLIKLGKVEWRNFLEGSGNEMSRIKLDSSTFVKLITDNNENDTDINKPKNAEKLDNQTEIFVHCRIEGCFEPIFDSITNFCAIHHKPFKRCQMSGCNKCAQGATKYCISHGGGRRCTFPGCKKGARDKNFCAAHGGGKRCSVKGCPKSAVGASNLCTAHGGGKRCKVDGCNKSSQSTTDYCVRHGGGKSCQYTDCHKAARGKSSYCASHGSNERCKVQSCRRTAIGEFNLCEYHDTMSADELKRVLFINGNGNHNSEMELYSKQLELNNDYFLNEKSNSEPDDQIYHHHHHHDGSNTRHDHQHLNQDNPMIQTKRNKYA